MKQINICQKVLTGTVILILSKFHHHPAEYCKSKQEISKLYRFSVIHCFEVIQY